MIRRRAVQEIPFGSLQPADQLATVPFEDPEATKLNARVVEVIAKPEKTDELRSLLCHAVIPLLRDRTGFVRSIVLTTHEELRRVMVVTFWSTEERSMCDLWEETPLVRELLSPLIDVWSRTRTCKVDVTEATESGWSVVTRLPDSTLLAAH
jgi:hypothetical protein